MFGRFGPWLARGGATTFTILGFWYYFDAMADALSHRIDRFTNAAMLCFLTAAVFYVGDQITTAIRELKGDESKEGDN